MKKLLCFCKGIKILSIHLALFFLVVAAMAREVTFKPPSSVKASTGRLRGFNVEGKYALEWSNSGYVQSDFDTIAEQGFNVVRLPLDYRCYTRKGDWTGFDEASLKQIDQAVAWCMARGIRVMLNIHRAPGFCIHDPDGIPSPAKVPENQRGSLWTDAASRKAFLDHWAMFARRYKRVPPGYLMFNLLNEPTGTDAPTYVGLMVEAAHRIREVRADRPVVVDGLNGGAGLDPLLVEAALKESFILSKHCYEPFMLTHYHAPWIEGAKSWPVPVWPPIHLNSYLYGPNKQKDSAKRTLRISGTFPKGATVAIRVGQVSMDGRLELRADGKGILTKDFKQGPGQGEWKKALYSKQWKIYQNIYDREYSVQLKAAAKEIAFEYIQGDWLTFSEISVGLPGREKKVFSPSYMEWGKLQDSYFLSEDMKDLRVLKEDPNGNPLPDDPFALGEWIAASQRGVEVVIGEFGVYNRVPHDVSMALQEAKLKAFQDAGFSWCLWAFKGEFGPFDPKRQGIALDKYRGMAVDRDYLKILKEY
ncbi:MAG: cellulase family glycosylhydrolase [Elusimicrobia bacterium]|nr:cellulase family glycosylhydrolase [Elusimicrobiota bacterium]